MHCHNTHVSILVHITYKQNPNYNPMFPKTKVLKEVHYYLFDDITHHTLHVQHACMMHFKHLQNIRYNLNAHIV
jgi:hypothetical protein